MDICMKHSAALPVASLGGATAVSACLLAKRRLAGQACACRIAAALGCIRMQPLHCVGRLVDALGLLHSEQFVLAVWRCVWRHNGVLLHCNWECSCTVYMMKYEGRLRLASPTVSDVCMRISICTVTTVAMPVCPSSQPASHLQMQAQHYHNENVVPPNLLHAYPAASAFALAHGCPAVEAAYQHDHIKSR